MAPKIQPKTKKELRAEAEAAERAAEEAARLQAEAAARVAAEVEAHRQELLRAFEAARDARLQEERQQLAPVLRQMQADRVSAITQRAAAGDPHTHQASMWLPGPCDRAAMNSFLAASLQAVPGVQAPNSMQDALEKCQACDAVAQHCMLLAAEGSMDAQLADSMLALACGPVAAECIVIGGASEQVGVSSSSNSNNSTQTHIHPIGDNGEGATCSGGNDGSCLSHAGDCDSGAAATISQSCRWDEAAVAAEADASRARVLQHTHDAAGLHAVMDEIMNAATAGFLLHYDEHVDSKGDVLVAAERDTMQLGLWVNTHRNPRFKVIAFGALGITVEIPKQLALANIALRLQRRPHKALGVAESSSCLSPVGGELLLDLLALPPPAKRSHGWTVRQVAAQHSSLTPLPYPIPPVGADLSMWQPDEPPAPLVISMPVQPNLLLPASVRVGWWDATQLAWSEDGISAVSYDATAGRLSFSTTRLGRLAMLQDTSACLPYAAWTIRPTGGLASASATIDIQAASGTISLEVGPGWVQLHAPAVPQLSQLLGQPMPPSQLLEACGACGLPLTPRGREAAQVRVQQKAANAEHAMCTDLAMLCRTHLVASSRWNASAGPDVCIARLSEVTDWQDGARTTADAAERIFRKEATHGPRRVLVARREGVRGVAVAAPLGSGDTNKPPAGADVSSVEALQAAAQDPAVWLHASLRQCLGAAEGVPGGGLAALPLPDASFVGCMAQVLLALRVLTFTA